ncbi:hypothetical protein CTAYLR_001869 [Chrysophaeum taylorii]|uniref:MAM domain-containing protein n=1 Tax=Chrysophaeum taylorii TaxID=2483200 RepID=A0AAD7U8B6_9STRA|nr:hypothetical protein CTAYLR_001869 [Chrysophaeum taylorii]
MPAATTTTRRRRTAWALAAVATLGTTVVVRAEEPQSSCPASNLNVTFSLVGATSLGTAVMGNYTRSGFCGCWPKYECLDCVLPAAVYYDETSASWVGSTSTACGGNSSGAELVVSSSDSSPLAITAEWSERGVGGALVPNSAIEVNFALLLIGTTEIADHLGVFGKYSRSGACDDRPAFVCVDCTLGSVELYYSEILGAWIVSEVTTCGDTFAQNMLAVDSAETPFEIENVWEEAIEDGLFRENKNIQVVPVGSFEPTQAPTTPAPSSLDITSLSLDSFGTASPCDVPSSWACVNAQGITVSRGSLVVVGPTNYVRFNEGFKTFRTLRVTARLIKDETCDNHAVYFSTSSTSVYTTESNVAGTIAIAWSCDVFEIRSPDFVNNTVLCPAGTYDLTVEITEGLTTATATSPESVCKASITQGTESLVVLPAYDYYGGGGGGYYYASYGGYGDDGNASAGDDQAAADETGAYFFLGTSRADGDDGSGVAHTEWLSVEITDRGIFSESPTVSPAPTASPAPTFALSAAPTAQPPVPVASAGCDFETQDLCGWTSGGTGELGWHRAIEGTPTERTGPLESSRGYFMFVEASTPRFPNIGPFVLESPPFDASISGAAYVTFEYHMYGSDMGILGLEFYNGSSWVPQGFLKSGDQGDVWRDSGYLRLPESATRVRFVGFTGEGFFGDMAVDNVAFASTSQPTFAPTSTPAPTATSIPTPLPTEHETFFEIRRAIQTQSRVDVAPVQVDFTGPIQIQVDVSIQGSTLGDNTTLFYGAYSTHLLEVPFGLSVNVTNIIFHGGWKEDSGAALLLYSHATAFLTDCIFFENYAWLDGGGIWASNNSFVHARNTIFQGNVADYHGAAILAQLGTQVILEDCSFLSNQASFYSVDFIGVGGAMFVHSSNLVARRTRFEGNLAVVGGALFLEELTTAMIEDCAFTSNEAIHFASDIDSGAGGAIASAEAATISLSNTELVGNGALRAGGAIWSRGFSDVVRTKIELAACTLVNNTVLLPLDISSLFLGGGAIYTEVTDVDAADVGFVGNDVQGGDGGGAVFVLAGTFIAERCTFVDNSLVRDDSGTTSARGGGAVSLDRLNDDDDSSGTSSFVGTSTFVATDCLFERNLVEFLQYTESRGGAVSCANATSCTIETTTFIGNTALRGGALHASDGSTTSLIACDFIDNVATEGGGALHISEKATFLLRNLSFVGNSVTEDDTEGAAGAALWCSSTSTTYAAFTLLDGSQTFVVENTCVLFFYQANNDGSKPHLENLLNKALNQSGATATLSIIPYTYPCSAGKYSIDGLEHGNTSQFLDRNGVSINMNEEYIDGTYALINEDACNPCPTGRFLSDPGSNESFHDSIDDCSYCEPGTFGNETGMSACSVCPAGKYSSDLGALFCTTAEPGFFVDTQGANISTPCPAGKSSVGGADALECEDCEPGRYQPEEQSTSCLLVEPGYFVPNYGATNQTACSPGTISVSQASNCTPCDAGRFAEKVRETSCKLASAGYYVPSTGASEETVCAPGTFSVSAASICEECSPGTFSEDAGASSCVLSSPGWFVPEAGASNETACPAGTYSGSGASSCIPCSPPEYQNLGAQTECKAECRRCPIPTTTSTEGSTFCDACEASYYWNTEFFERVGRIALEEEEEQCTECCVDCEDACDDDDEDECLECDDPGVRLESLPVVHRGHTGALCGACKRGWDLDYLSDKCKKCGKPVKVVISARSIVVAICVILVLIVLVYKFVHFDHLVLCKKAFFDSLTGKLNYREGTHHAVNMATARRGKAVQRMKTQLSHNLESLEDAEAITAAEPVAQAENEVARAAVEQANTEEAAHAKQRKFWMSIMTKAKICIAAYQISSSTPWSLPQVHFPAITAYVLKLASVLQLNFFQVGSSDCIRHMDYFEELIIITVFPFALAFVGVGLYTLNIFIRLRAFNARIDTRQEKSRIIYMLLLLMWVALPGCSSYTFRYFSCLHFDRGRGRDDYDALAVDLSIRCDSRRYKSFLWYVILAIVVWPIGCPLIIGIVLFRYRKYVNPDLNALEEAAGEPVGDVGSGHGVDANLFRRAQRRHKEVFSQLKKVEIRESIRELEDIQFLWEEYEPRCIYFPVFESARRIFLTGVLAMFGTGSSSQLALGLFGTLFSYKIFALYQPYVEDDDDVVSEVAQMQLVIIFFAALIIYVSDNLEEREGIFSSNTFGVILVILFLGAFVVAIYFTLINIFGYTLMNDAYDVTMKKIDSGRRSSWRVLDANRFGWIMTSCGPAVSAQQVEPEKSQKSLSDQQVGATLVEASDRDLLLKKKKEAVLSPPSNDVDYVADASIRDETKTHQDPSGPVSLAAVRFEDEEKKT